MWLPAANLACRQGTAAMLCPTSWGIHHEQAAPLTCPEVQTASLWDIRHIRPCSKWMVEAPDARCLCSMCTARPASGAVPCIMRLLQCRLVFVACRKVAEYQQSCAARVSQQLQRSRLARLATVLQAWVAVAEHRHAVQQRMLHVVLRISQLKASAAFTQWREWTAESAGQQAWVWQLRPRFFTESCLQQLYTVQDAGHLSTFTNFLGFAVAQILHPDDMKNCNACRGKTGAGKQ